MVAVPRKVLVFQYKQHTFYIDPSDDDGVFTHIDNRGRSVDTAFYDEEEAIEYVDNLARESSHA